MLKLLSTRTESGQSGMRCCENLQIHDNLLEYRKKGSGSGETTGAENRVACNPNTGARDLGEKQVCDVPVDEFHPCTSANQYNYEEAGPCVFLKLNKVGFIIIFL